MLKLISALSIIFLLSACGSKNMMTNKTILDKTTVKNFEIDRYLGEWYEIARFQHSFEKDLVGVTATYSMRPDGKIKVLNQGYKNSLDGKLKQATGVAKIPDPEHPARLKVSFFWIFFAEYNIMELDTINYSWALVGSSSENYLWILSRNKTMDDQTYEMLVNNAKVRGYDVERLFRVPQH